jgi:hypothetical protein
VAEEPPAKAPRFTSGREGDNLSGIPAFARARFAEGQSANAPRRSTHASSERHSERRHRTCSRARGLRTAAYHEAPWGDEVRCTIGRSNSHVVECTGGRWAALHDDVFGDFLRSAGANCDPRMVRRARKALGALHED